MIIDGRRIANQIREELSKKVTQIKGRKPGLAFVLVGDDPASHTYVGMKKKACSKIGFYSEDIILPSTTSEKELIEHIQSLNKNPQIDGILVQLPLPKEMEETQVLQTINPEKDVDGFHPINFGKLLQGDQTGFVPCTPLGIQLLLEKSSVDIEGKHVVIVGRSNLVGKPLAALLMQKNPRANATVTIAHSKSENLQKLTQQADILVVAVGKEGMITENHVKKGAVVIDVGINKTAKGQIVGDVVFESVKKACSAITPVPGGVGPMTIAMLLANTFKSFCRSS